MSTAQLNRTAAQINSDLALARSAVQPAVLTGYATASQGTKADSALQAADIVNTLTSTETTKPLSAAQGKVLNDSIGNIAAALDAINGESV